ncbi:MAG: PAS domain-containing sensor histidine kinase, partial [Myxococcales bacterium]
PYEGLMTRSALTEQTWRLPDGTEVLVTARLHRAERLGPVTRVAVSLRNGRSRKVLDRERSDLVATVAHELRSPLTGVKGFVTTLLNKWDLLNDDQKKLMLTTVKVDSERLSRLITELLDVARIDTGRLPLYPRPVDPEPIVQRVVDLAGASTARSLVVDSAEDLGTIHADPDKFAQVVTNLVDNAMRHGAGDVRVSLVSDLDDVALIVDDEGDGIAEEIRQRVFTKFWKHGTRGGSGLGMYIVGGLVRAHGGRIDIGDSPSGGARVRVNWPRAGS